MKKDSDNDDDLVIDGEEESKVDPESLDDVETLEASRDAGENEVVVTSRRKGKSKKRTDADDSDDGNDDMENDEDENDEIDIVRNRGVEPDSLREELMTKPEFDALVKRLNNLRSAGRMEIAEKLKEARSFGDLSENSEYEEAKKQQGFLEGDIAEVEARIEHARIIDEANIDITAVSVGTTVSVLNLDTQQEVQYTMVGNDLDTNMYCEPKKIDRNSIVGGALIGMRVGMSIDVKTNIGLKRLKVLSIEKAREIN